MCVGDPGEYQCDGREDDCRKKKAKIADCNSLLSSQENVPDCSDQPSSSNEGTTNANSVRDESTRDNTDEAKNVWRSGEAVRLDGSEGSHFRDDGGYEKG